MKLTSQSFENEYYIPLKYSCKGADYNPQLQWKDVPEDTKSFALSCKDPDAPVGTFVHWLVYDIDKSKREIPEDSVPGKQVVNNFRKKDYGGPCPPSGVHRYYFTLHALDTKTLHEISSMDDFDNEVEKHTIEKAVLMGKFKR